MTGLRIPQAPFHEREQLDVLRLPRHVAQGHFLHLGPRAQRHEEGNFGLQAVFAPRYDGVVHAVAALVAVERRAAGFPTGVPHTSPVVHVKVTPSVVHRHTVVAVAREAAELGILAESVSARRVRNQPEEVFRAQVVNPRERGARVGYHVLAPVIIKMSVFHVVCRMNVVCFRFVCHFVLL